MVRCAADAANAAPWRNRGSLCRCSLGQSAGQHSSPYGHLADSAASATPPPTATSAAPLPAPRPAPAPGADSAPSRPWTRSHPEDRPAKSRAFRSAVARRLARPWQATAQLTTLARPPGRLTRRLFTSFHSATLRSAPRSGAPPPRRRSSQKRRHCPQAPSAMPPYDSAALHFVKTGETGDSPGQRITSPSSGNARKLAGLRCGLGHALAPNVSLASGRAGQLVPAPLPPQPARPEARTARAPATQTKRARLPAFSASPRLIELASLLAPLRSWQTGA